MSNTFYDIPVSKVIAETDQAKSFIFDVPSDLSEKFQFSAGQYLTLKFDLNGEEERRSYSLSSAPYENKWRVCVKRVKGGKISNHLCDNINEGDVISVMAPEGRFAFKSNPEEQAQYFLFAAGSGITPIMSIAKEVLESEPLSTVYLLYGNHSESQVIYNEELDSMTKKYGDQFFVKHVYSDKAEKKGLLKSIFKKSTIELPYFPGKIGKDTIKKFLGIHGIKNSQKAKAYICGPGSMNEDVKQILVKQSFIKDQVHFESFGTSADAEQDVAASGNMSDVIVVLDDAEIKLTIDTNVTVLDALVDAGYDPPHSCSSGACSSCMAKLEEGKVTMDVTHALDDDDINDGYILTCQARVDSEKIRIVYE